MNAEDEVPEHGLGNVEICDHAVTHRANRHDVSGGSPDHPLGFRPNGQDLLHAFGIHMDGYYRRLAQDDSLSFDINECIGGSQIYRQIVGKLT